MQYKRKHKDAERYILSTNPILYLPLYRLDGSPFTSADGYGHTCTVTGALPCGQGRIFDNSDDKIDCGSSYLFDECADMTILAWVRRDAVGGNDAIVSDSINSASADDHFAQFLIDTNNKIGFNFGDDTNYHNTASQSTVDIAWHFVGANRNNTTKKVGYFLDSVAEVLINYTQAVTTPLTLGANSLYVGLTGMVGFTYPFGGTIGEVIIYNRVLSPMEVLRIYQATKWRY